MQVSFTESLEIAKVCQQCGLSLMMWGPTSSGKSSVVKKLGEELDMRVVDFRLSQTDAGELLGMPYMSEVDGEKRMKYAAPDWWPEKGEKVIIFLDELNRARNDLINSAFQLALDYTIGTRKLPEGCMVISACNPSTDYAVNELDPAMLNRFVNIETVLDVLEFESYLKNSELTGSVLDYLRLQPGSLFGPDYKSTVPKQQPTPRTWEKVAKVEKLSKTGKVHATTKTVMLYALLGAETATEFLAFTSGTQPVLGKDLRAEPDKYITKVLEQVTEHLDLVQVTLSQFVDEATKTPTSFKQADYTILLKLSEGVPLDLILKTCTDIMKTPAKNAFNKVNKLNDAALYKKFQELDRS